MTWDKWRGHLVYNCLTKYRLDPTSSDKKTLDKQTAETEIDWTIQFRKNKNFINIT